MLAWKIVVCDIQFAWSSLTCVCYLKNWRSSETRKHNQKFRDFCVSKFHKLRSKFACWFYSLALTFPSISMCSWAQFCGLSHSFTQYDCSLIIGNNLSLFCNTRFRCDKSSWLSTPDKGSAAGPNLLMGYVGLSL